MGSSNRRRRVLRVRWRSLRTKIVLWFFVPTAIILVAVALANFYSYQDVTGDLVLERDRDLTRLAAGRLATQLRGFTDLLADVAADPGFGAGDPEASQDSLQRAGSRLVVFDGGVVVLDTFGVVEAAGPRAAGLQGRDLSGQSFFPRLVRARDQSPVFSDIVSVVPGASPVVAAAVPISGREGELLGSLVGMFLVNPSGTSALYGEVVKLRLAEKGNVYLVDHEGKVIYHSQASRIGSDLSSQPVVRDVLRGQAGAVRTRDPDGRDIVAGYASVGRTGWGLVTEEAWSVLIGESRDHQLVLICLLILGGAVPILFVVIGLRRVMRPLEDLVQAARQVARGDFAQTINASSKDEFGDLATEFNQMASQLQQSYQTLERRVEARTEELRETHRLLNAVVQAAPVAILAHDQKAHIRMWSRGAEQMFGWTEGEVIGRDVPPFVATDKEGEYRSNVKRVLQGESREGFEAQRQTKDGALIDVGIWTAPLRDAGGDVDGIMTIMVDLTQLKRTEEALRGYAGELARSNADLEQFAYVASHDLQEPLRMVSSYTQLLARRYRDRLDSDADEFIAYAVDGASRMQDLINDLLAYSRVGSGSKPLDAVDCGSVLHRVAGNLQAAINDAGAEVTSDDLPTVRGDESQLALLFQNLIANGIKFRSDRTPQVHLSAERGNGLWLFSVRDNGIGIEREYSERIFGIFQRLHTREEYPGTGVGLAICKRVVERHDGTIWVESEPGNGSVFKFTLPASEEDGR